MLMGLFLIITMAIVIAACNDNSQEPSREDIIQAVRNHVGGKTYSKTVKKDVPRTHTCSQIEVNIDPRCPFPGATYSINESKTVTETHTCSSLPGPEAGWSVTSTGNDTWRVSHAGSAWDVTKADGRAAGAEGVIRVSEFAFKIKPQQDC
jgi:hypothetical protein